MMNITICQASLQEKGTIQQLRFRLRDGREIQLYHKSSITCKQKELAQFGLDAKVRRGVRVYNAQLEAELLAEIEIMTEAYTKMLDEGKDLTSESFEKVINELKHPILEQRSAEDPLPARFRRYAEDAYRDHVVGASRYQHFMTLAGKIERYLIIKGISKTVASEVTPEMVMDFRSFILEEYKYTKRYPHLYKNLNRSNKPTRPLSINTAATQMKAFQTFFNVLEQQDEILKSPFRKLSRDRKRAAMHTMYDEPFFLRQEEFEKVRTIPLPQKLENARDAFVLQTALGCRISDFQRMGQDNLSFSSEGIPFIHYLPQKTAGTQATNQEIQTPLVRFAYDIIQQYHFSFPVLKNIYGSCGFNAKIRSILQLAGIDRKVPIFNEEKGKNEYIPLYSLSGTKLCRKTHVDMVNKVQLDMYAAGLHREGSSAVRRYTAFELKDKFTLLNLAFRQEAYSINSIN